MTSIGSGTFAYCKNLVSVTIPQNLTSIGGDNRYGGAFGGCSSLTTIIIPNKVTSIGNQAFLGCDNLKTVIIGSGVKSIGSYAFMNCPKLTDVYCYSENVPSANSEVFKNSYIEYATLHVPQSSLSLYQQRATWNSFGTIVGDGEAEDVPKCATPTIKYENGNISFSCETDGVEYHYEVTDTYIKIGSAATIALKSTYRVTVYATKAGYSNSDVATMDINIAGGGIEGDVNGDGKVNAADVVRLTNIILERR